MKKLYQILAVALIGLAMPMLSACGDDDFEEKVSSVKVTSATSVIPVMGGTGTINVAGEGITATSSANWLKVSVSGNTVKMVGEANTSKQSRNALVTISAANGDKTAVNVSQVGMVIDLIADDRYLFDVTNNPDVELINHSNVDITDVITDNWIHVVKTETGFKLSVEENEDNNMRIGYVGWKYNEYEYPKQIKVMQWGKEYPFLAMNKVVFKDENGIEQTKDVTIEKSTTKKGQYLVRGLVPEGDVQLMLSTVVGKKECYIPCAYQVGKKKKTVDGKDKTFYLRCVMSCRNAEDGSVYIPTESQTDKGTSPYRMSFKWELDANDEPYLVYFRNAELDAEYNTDGFKVYRYISPIGTTDNMRDGDDPEYTFVNIKFCKQ